MTGSGSSSYVYDTLGDRSSGPGATYTYNLLGQMASETSGSTTTYYRDNGDGLQAEEGSSPTTATAQLIWDSATSSEPELLSDGTNYYIYGPGTTPVEQFNPSENDPPVNPYFINFSPTDSFYTYTNTSGVFQNAINFDAYGAVSNVYATSPDAFGFAGQYFDPSGTYDMRARYCSTSTGNLRNVGPRSSPNGSGLPIRRRRPGKWLRPIGAMQSAGDQPVPGPGAV